jgi:hypothetical protein
MNLRENDARAKMCPMTGRMCEASQCMLWQWDEPMIEGPDSYVSEPGPTGHCGLEQPRG